MGIFDYREMSLAQAKAIQYNAEGVSPRVSDARQAEIDEVEADFRRQGEAEVARLREEEGELRSSLEDAYADNAAKAREIRTNLALGEITLDESRKALQVLMSEEGRLDGRAAAVAQVAERRKAVEADPSGYVDRILAKYPSIPRPKWGSF